LVGAADKRAADFSRPARTNGTTRTGEHRQKINVKNAWDKNRGHTGKKRKRSVSLGGKRGSEEVSRGLVEPLRKGEGERGTLSSQVQKKTKIQ